jgi:hypothetical protein
LPLQLLGSRFDGWFGKGILTDLPIVRDVTHDEIVEYVTTQLEGTLVVVASEEDGAPEVAWGDTFFFYDPDGVTLPDKRLPYATIVINDYPGFDEASDLKRSGVFRLNMSVSRDTYELHTSADDVTGIDYSVLDEVIPHPVYGPQSWLSVLNPGINTEDTVRALLTEAHHRARDRYERSTGRPSGA